MARAKFLIDTSIIIDALRKHQPAQRFLDFIDQIVVSVVTQAELIEGARNKEELIQIKRNIKSCRILPVDQSICRRAISYIERYFLKYGILFDDALIAATAVNNDMTLATTEKRHFQPIRGLKIHCPY